MVSRLAGLLVLAHPLGGIQPGLDPLGQVDLLLGVEQRDLADLLEVGPDGVRGSGELGVLAGLLERLGLLLVVPGELLGLGGRPRPWLPAVAARPGSVVLLVPAIVVADLDDADLDHVGGGARSDLDVVSDGSDVDQLGLVVGRTRSSSSGTTASSAASASAGVLRWSVNGTGCGMPDGCVSSWGRLLRLPLMPFRFNEPPGLAVRSPLAQKNSCGSPARWIRTREPWSCRKATVPV